MQNFKVNATKHCVVVVLMLGGLKVGCGIGGGPSCCKFKVKPFLDPFFKKNGRG
jgi:hypothetical protein